MADKPKPILVTTPVATASMASVHEPDTEGKYADGKYKITLIFNPNEVDLSKVEEAALKIGARDWPKIKPERLNITIKDGDDKTYTANSKKVRDGEAQEGDIVDGFAGMKFITAKTSFPPQLIDRNRGELAPNIKIMGGDKVKAVLAPVKSDVPMKGTVTFRLQAIQLIEKRAGGGRDYSDLFDDEGEGFGGAQASESRGVEAGVVDDDEIPF